MYIYFTIEKQLSSLLARRAQTYKSRVRDLPRSHTTSQGQGVVRYPISHKTLAAQARTPARRSELVRSCSAIRGCGAVRAHGFKRGGTASGSIPPASLLIGLLAPGVETVELLGRGWMWRAVVSCVRGGTGKGTRRRRKEGGGLGRGVEGGAGHAGGRCPRGEAWGVRGECGRGRGRARGGAPSGAKVRRSARRCEAGGGRAAGREVGAGPQAWWCLVRRA